ncbi:aminoglycoside phosphotransferase family protein [Bailinhaonella thermotolerans]|uniref:Aminoglycoside phosphotransferase family protein n=2 Tax=Bailinhaonella thermotolerans TaxID=1070861 RepID=A0A3A3ZZL7_9ACTN|nr:aminoglycoside phosphotransferase family protein [Bailinhaonella thermotolerans]
MEEACAMAGLSPSGATLIRLGENAVFRLTEPIVVRVARSTAYASDARKEVAVARWLAEKEFPAVRALPIDQPVIAGNHVVTFWESLSESEHYGSPADVARLLAELHRLEAPVRLSLGRLEPFARAERRLASNGWFSDKDHAFLNDRLMELRTAYARLEFALPPGLIHGDASVGNVIHDRRGRPVLIDLDGFTTGPREWDLVLTAIYYERFGWHTAAEYAEFVKIYGFDVMQWPGYPVLRDVREFLMVTWLSQKAPQDERAAAEVRKRIDSLRTGTSRRDWEPY